MAQQLLTDQDGRVLITEAGLRIVVGPDDGAGGAGLQVADTAGEPKVVDARTAELSRAA